MNLADILGLAFTAESAFLRIKKLNENSTTDKAQLTIKTKMAQLYLYDALDAARKAANNVLDSYASGAEKWALCKVCNILLPTYHINPKDTCRAIADDLLKRA
jgi:hypothetical protein